VRVVVDLERCQGHAQCELVAPRVFELRGEQAHVLVEQPPPELADAVEDAILMCPENAISAVDD
jgi:ferredoxin